MDELGFTQELQEYVWYVESNIMNKIKRESCVVLSDLTYQICIKCNMFGFASFEEVAFLDDIIKEGC